MDDVESVLKKVRQRTSARRTGKLRRLVWADEALAEAAELVMLVDGSQDVAPEALAGSVEAVALLHWARYLTSGESDGREFMAAVSLFVLLKRLAPELVPAELDRLFQRLDLDTLGTDRGLVRSMWDGAAAAMVDRVIGTGTIDGLDQAVYLWERALAATTPADQQRSRYLFNLGNTWHLIAQHRRDEAGHRRALGLVEESLDELRRGDPAFASRTASRAAIYKDLHHLTGDPVLLRQAVRLYEDVLALVPATHIDWASHMLNYCDAGRLLFEANRDAELADRVLVALAGLFSGGRPPPQARMVLSYLLTDRFGQTSGQPVPREEPAEPSSHALWAFEQTGDSNCQWAPTDSMRAVSPEFASQSAWNQLLALALNDDDPVALDEAIEVCRAAVATPSSAGSPAAQLWETLGILLLNKYILQGDESRIAQSIEAFERAIGATDDAAARRASITLLCRAHFARAHRTKAPEDVDALFAVARRYDNDLPEGSAEWREVRMMTGIELAERSLNTDAGDLDEAIESLASVEGDEDLATLLQLARATRERYQRRADPADLDRTVVAYARILGLREPEDAFVLAVVRIGELLCCRFGHDRRQAHLDAAIGLLRGAVVLAEGGGLAFPSLEVLAVVLATRAESADCPEDLDEAIEVARRSSDFLLLGDLLVQRDPSESGAEALMNAMLCDLRDGSLDIGQAEQAMPGFPDDERTLGTLLRQTAEATRLLWEGDIEEALRRARLLVAGLRGVSSSAVTAGARAEASMILVDAAREVLSRRADPLLFQAALDAGEWTGQLAAERDDDTLAGTAAFRLGTLYLELYGRFLTPGWERRGRSHAIDPRPHAPWREWGERGEPDLPPPASLPEPVATLRTAVQHLRRAVALRAGQDRGEAARRLVAALLRLRDLDAPIDGAELDKAVGTALRLLPDDAFPRRLALLSLRPGPSQVSETRRIATQLERDLDGYVEREGAEAAVEVAVSLARLFADTEPERAFALLTQVVDLTHGLDEHFGIARVLMWQITLVARIHASGWQMPGSSLDLDTLTENTSGTEFIGRLLTCAIWAVESERSGAEIRLGLAALDRIEPSDVVGLRNALHFLRARLSALAAENAEGSERTRLVTAAIRGFKSAGASQYVLSVIESSLMPISAEITDEDALMLLVELGMVAKTVPLTDPATTEVLQQFYARLLCGLLTTGVTDPTLGLLLCQAKGARLGEVLLAGPPALADADAAALSAVVPERTVAAPEPLDELMTVAWADTRHRRPADTPEGRLRNRQRAFDSQVTDLVMAHRTFLPYAFLKLGTLRDTLDERTALIIYLPILSADGRGGLAQLIVTPEDEFAGLAWDNEQPPGDMAFIGDTAFTLSTMGADVAQVRTALQADPGPAPATREALVFLTGQLLFGGPSLEFLAGLRSGGRDRLLIAPYGPFHFFPFHLAGPEHGRWLDNWKVAYLPNLDLLRRRNTRTGRKASLTSIGLDYLDSDHPTLVEATTEATECAAAFGTDPVLNAEATRERVLTALGESRYVHLAAHGSHNIDAPVLQTIHLADGPLAAYDLLSLDLTGLELVSLSACETGLGRIDRADNLRGIPAALFLAGVQVLIATLWPVSNEAAAYFFPQLYDELARGTAIWDAFHSVRHQTREGFPQYRDWGAFVLMGKETDGRDRSG
ncbi:CHAT domain-containing protein [Streptomyces sp. NPDC020799]|uniref:CHAT domain-containing protein n=1 Tax=Streptomyces sp. NPDC020799 TaxID=3365091 RepID=UPI0037B560B9